MSESLPTLITASKSLSDFRAESSELELSGSFKNVYQMQCSGCNSFMPNFFEHCIVCGHTILERSHLPFIDRKAVYDTYGESMEMRSFTRQKNLSTLKRKVKKDKKTANATSKSVVTKRERLEKLSLPKDTIAAIQAVDILDDERRRKKVKMLKSIMLKASSLEMKNAKMIEEIMQRTIKLKERRSKIRQYNLEGYLDEIESIQSLYSKAKLKLIKSHGTLHINRPVGPSYLNDPREEGELGKKEAKAWLWTNLLTRPVSREDRPHHHHSKHTKTHEHNHDKKHLDKGHGKVPMFWGNGLNNNNDDDEDENNNRNNEESNPRNTDFKDDSAMPLPSIIEDEHDEYEYKDEGREHDLDRHYNLMHTTTNLTFHTDDDIFTSETSNTRAHNLEIDLQVLQQMANELQTLEQEITTKSRVPMTMDGFKNDENDNDCDPPTRQLFPIVDDLKSKNAELPSQVAMIQKLRQKAHFLLQHLASNDQIEEKEQEQEEGEEEKTEQILRLQAQVEHYDYFMLQQISWQLHNLELAEMVREHNALDTAADAARSPTEASIFPPITQEKGKTKQIIKDMKSAKNKLKNNLKREEKDKQNDTPALFFEYSNASISRPRTVPSQLEDKNEFSHLQARQFQHDEDDSQLTQITLQLESIIEAKRLYSIEREIDMHEIEEQLTIPTLEGHDLIPKVGVLLPHESRLLTPPKLGKRQLQVDLLAEYDKFPKLSVNDEETENANILFLEAEETENRSALRLQALLDVENCANFQSAYEKFTLQPTESQQQSVETENDELEASLLTREQLPSHKIRVTFDFNLKFSRLYQRSIFRMRAVLTSLTVDLRMQNSEFLVDNKELQAAIDVAKDAIDCAHEVHSLVKELLSKFHTETSNQRLKIAQEISEAMRHVARIERTFQRKFNSSNNTQVINSLSGGKSTSSSGDSSHEVGEAQEVISLYGEKITRLQQQEADLIEAIRQQERSIQETIDLWRPKHSQVLNECTIAMIRAQGFVFAFRT